MTRGPRDGWVTAPDGTRIAYRDHGGDGPGLLLLHGGGANLESMDQWADRFRATRRCVAVDLRCCGQSDDVAHFSLTEAAEDLDAVVDHLALGPVDVLGHSMGGFVGGFYGTRHPESRIVSIDGFGPGTVTVGSDAERAEFGAFQASMREQFFAMTAPPDRGDDAWRDAQVDALCALFPAIGYTAPNARAMAARNFVVAQDGTFRRRPPRHLFADAFADDGAADILRMYRHTSGPALIVRCTESGAPAVLDTELDGLCAENPHITVLRLPLTHLAPAWDAIDEVAHHAARFLATAT
ncbi:alpha/beta hydrolase [Nocardioides sp. GY 10113]|uniref:alpha/beta fold hydrolase n=1 Tax=Nocardioides sp. GY 10113 TaxID=2569761 RepID=UPI0010A866D5|nr:alpha/beta hydrolase [Nocardioides sp. GY 10113]TIC79670.1 alpha/beta hydrolase [Nocardioides sp. GY 10113]TIC85795.1 alpha/beta hydrolase [Nocardioides sp. GY 10113]